jgi:transcriptional regulator with XRE-family HTH domain
MERFGVLLNNFIIYKENVKKMKQSKIIGSKIANIRKFRTLTQEEVADGAGLTRVYVGQIERGEVNPSIDVLHKISTALDCVMEISFTPVS